MNKNDYRNAIVAAKIIDMENFQDYEGRKYHIRVRLIGPNGFNVICSKESREKLGYFKIRRGFIFKLLVSHKISFSNLTRGEAFIDNTGVANEVEIEEYLRRNKGRITNALRAKRFVETLRKLEKLNVYTNPIEEETEKKEEVIAEEKKPLRLNTETKIMTKIELYLERLKSYDKELYQKYLDKYLEIINNSDKLSVIPMNRLSLEKLAAEIELCFIYRKNNGESILSYLYNKAHDYLENFLEGASNETISLNDINKIMELILKTQDDYDLNVQRQIFQHISMLYLFEIYENKDTIKIEDINNDCIKECINSILTIIFRLLNDDIIECDRLIDLGIEYTMEDLLDIIRNIRFNKGKVKTIVE